MLNIAFYMDSIGEHPSVPSIVQDARKGPREMYDTALMV